MAFASLSSEHIQKFYIDIANIYNLFYLEKFYTLKIVKLIIFNLFILIIKIREK